MNIFGKIAAILGIALLCNNHLRADDGKHFLWEVSSPKSTVKILGSIHFAKPELYPLSPVIEQAFDTSDTLAVEVDMDAIDPKVIQTKMLSACIYPENDEIRKHLDRQTFILLLDYLKRQHIPLTAVRRMKPGLLAITLTANRLMKLGFTPDHGIDHYFLAKARGKKKIVELETFDEQLALFSSISDPNAFVRYTLRDLDSMEGIMNDAISAWKNGDADKINQMFILDTLQKSPEMRTVMQSFFFDRNLKMAEKIMGMLDKTGNCFVVVGAGHLVGELGIIELLRKSGKYKIKQL